MPAGNGEESGRWTDGIGGGEATLVDGRVRVAQAGSIVTDAFGQPYYQPGGHHEMPRGVYDKWNLQPETRAVFKGSTTGTIPQMWLRTSPDGVPVGNFWNGANGAHANYNKAVQELSDRYLQTNKISPTEMTPDQARGLLKEIRETQDPRIKDFNATMRLIRRLFPLRTGRRSE
jgi:hypothetical protein